MDVTQSGNMDERISQRMKVITDEACDFPYPDARSLAMWLKTAKQVWQQAEIYEADGDLLEAYRLYTRHASLMVEKLLTHPDVRASSETLKIVRKDGSLSLSTVERIKPQVRKKLEQSIKEEDEKEKRRREAEKRALNRKSEQRGSSSYHPDEHEHQRLAHVARQAWAYTSPAIRAARNRRYNFEDSDFAQDMQKVRSQLEGRGNSQTSSRPPLPPRKTSALTNMAYPSVPSATPLPASSLEGQWQGKESGLDDRLRPPSRPDKVPIQTFDQGLTPAPARPPKEGYTEPTSPGWPHDDVKAPPPLPPKAAVGAPAADPVPEEGQRIYESRESLEDGTPLRTVFLPPSLRQAFLDKAKSNTDRELETCGILCGYYKNNALFISSLVIPEQKSTKDTCEMTDEGEIALFDWVDEKNLITLGWIHTHPTQTCFMSSRDIHTHCGYQSMIRESIAIVCAPRMREPSEQYGIFRLTDPPGMKYIRNCNRQGTFHPHDEVNIVKRNSGHVDEKNKEPYEVHDLRKR